MKTKFFLIAMISFSLLCTTLKAETNRIQMDGFQSLHYAWLSGDTFIIDKPAFFASTMWYVNHVYVGSNDSLIYVPTMSGENEITATWNGNYLGFFLYLHQPIKKSLQVCQDLNYFNLDSISKGSWQGSGIALFENKLYPTVTPVGTYLLYCYDLMSNNSLGLLTTLTLTINPIPTVMISTLPTLDVTETYDLSKYVTANAGGVWTGKGVINADYSSYLNSAIAGVGTHMIQYTYTDPRSGCSASQVEYIKIK